ncbi:hypothetical protein F4774DRAFT_423276 [Daldinia eschscholtzii]|nr:hypothetical protein F4774DRAFT_423276 [Daldinia eschscholtzii]
MGRNLIIMTSNWHIGAMGIRRERNSRKQSRLDSHHFCVRYLLARQRFISFFSATAKTSLFHITYLDSVGSTKKIN